MLLEIDFPSHCGFGDGAHFIADSCTLGKFIDALSFDECRVHVETNESSHSAVHIVVLERTIHF